jgi:hypothetical protein
VDQKNDDDDDKTHHDVSETGPDGEGGDRRRGELLLAREKKYGGKK